MTKIIDLCGCMTLDRQHPGVPVYGFKATLNKSRNGARPKSGWDARREPQR